MKKFCTILLVTTLSPFSTLAEAVEADTPRPGTNAKVVADQAVPRKVADAIRAELRVRSLRNLEPEKLKDIAQAGLELKPSLRSHPQAHRFSDEVAGAILVVGGTALVTGGAVLVEKKKNDAGGVALIVTGLALLGLGWLIGQSQ